MTGLELLEQLKESGDHLPAVMITGKSDVAVAIRAMKAGALDFIEKPVAGAELLDCLNRALEHASDDTKLLAWQENARESIASLTLREREIMDLVLTGHPNKNIAVDLGISQRTVESHRASIMKKTGSKFLPELVRLALAASG
jgi:two-component system CheB/CheR fusion protein